MSACVPACQKPAINFQVIDPFSREGRTLINGVTISKSNVEEVAASFLESMDEDGFTFINGSQLPNAKVRVFFSRLQRAMSRQRVNRVDDLVSLQWDVSPAGLQWHAKAEEKTREWEAKLRDMTTPLKARCD